MEDGPPEPNINAPRSSGNTPPKEAPRPPPDPNATAPPKDAPRPPPDPNATAPPKDAPHPPPDPNSTAPPKDAAHPPPDPNATAPPPDEPEEQDPELTGKAKRGKRKKAIYRKKTKDQRKNLKGWMEGRREDVFLPLVLVYADLSSKGAWQQLETKLLEWERLYHHHFPWPMEDHEEPETLTPYDPLNPPLEHVNSIKLRLRRWLAYRAKKLKKCAVTLAKTHDSDAYAEMARQLAGLDKTPRQRHAANVWADDNRAEPDDSQPISFRNKVKRALFDGLSAEIQKEYKAKAIAEGPN
ncbi:hypothetical protein BDZ89DRAFT_1152510 [Hymenopellis radicata]|nr:hypothetical protein BDZ89DRAFT_1152510 [Hymenopellis radicata]